MIKKENKVGSFKQSEAKDYSDILDRELAREFLYANTDKSEIKFGDIYQLDLISGNNTGCDVEFLTFNALNSFRYGGGFRIPNRKEHYWSGSNLREGKNGKWRNDYQFWSVDYIQLFDDRTKLLFYKSDIIKQYVKNVIHIDTPGWDEKNKWFIKLPYTECKDIVKLYIRNDYGKWEKAEIN